MTFWEKIQNIDRRWIYMIVALCIIVPLLIPFNSKTYVTEPTVNLYKKIDSFSDKEDKAILLSFSHDASTMAELFPMEVSILRHCFERNIKVFLICFSPPSAPLMAYALNVAKEDYPDLESGVDYCNFGYKPYGLFLPIVLGMGDDVGEAVDTDADGRKVKNLEIMKGIRNYDDLNLIIDFAASAAVFSWITYARVRFGANVAAGVTAVMAADNYPYLQSGQLVGMLAGLKGAAEYEKLVDVFAAYEDEQYSDGRNFSQEVIKNTWVPIMKKTISYTSGETNVQTDVELPYKFKQARIGMNAQSIAHIMIIVFIIIGNIGYFLSRKNKNEV
ncbi:MAG: hypothetical protein K9N06_05260 [Candidatus Cloacimonetes bacterium]|nr:hypothetical protein [Candidatus Cloacimonadota bacterium]